MSEREHLPDRRGAELVDFEHAGRKWTLTVGRFADGRVGEVFMAANLAGGKEGLVGYLKTQAELVNPSAFMTGLSKLLPLMLEGNPDAPLIVERVYYTREAD